MMTKLHVPFVFLACFLVMALTASTAWADLYRYEDKDGSTLITTQPRKGLKLIEVIRDGSDEPSKPGKSNRPRKAGAKESKSERFQRLARESRAKAGQAKAARPGQSFNEHSFDAYIREASETYQIPFAFIKGVIRVESNFNPYAVSRTGAMGLMQLMPGTARFMGVEDGFDPRQNIFGGTKLLRVLTDQYNGDINLLLSAYNAGEGAVEKYDGIPYQATQDYVRKVFRFYKQYQREGAGQ